MRHFVLLVLVPLTLLTMPACEGLVDPSDNVLTELTGTIEPGGGFEHRVTVRRNGEYSLRVRSLTPSEGTFLHVILGLVNQGFCAVVQQTFAAHNQLALVGPMQQGEYCVTVGDPGVLTEPVQYLLEFSHP